MAAKQSRTRREHVFLTAGFAMLVACGDPAEVAPLEPHRSSQELVAPCTASSALDFDSENCGACGLVCGAGQVCKAGMCVAAAATHMVASGGLTTSLLQVGTWTERGPELGGRIDGLVVDPVADPVWLIGSPGGGIWRKNDSQSVWSKPANYALADFSIVHLERDLIATTKYYGVAWSTLYSTTDLGNTWTLLVNPGANPGPLHPLQTDVVDPKPFAQLSFSASTRAVLFGKPCSGLWYSFDGANFTQHFPFSGGSTNEDNCLGNIAPDPISKRVYFSTLKAAGFEAAHVYRSTCAWANNSPCLTWEAANTNLPQNVNVSAITHANRTTANHFIALVNQSGDTQTWETTTGTSWSLKSTQSSQWTPRPLSFTGTPGELFQGNVRAFHSANLGNSWTAFTLPGSQEHVDVRAIFFSKTLNKVYTATDGANNTGTQANFTKWSWTTGSVPTSGASVGHTGLKVWQAYYAAPVKTTSGPRRMIVGSHDNGAICFNDAASGTWTTLGAPAAGDAISLKVSPVNSNKAYARTEDGSCFRRTGNAQQLCADIVWTTVCPTGGVPSPSYWHNNILSPHPTILNKVYFLGGDHVRVSTNSGDTFTAWPLPTGHRGASIYVDAAAALYVGTAGNGVVRSTNDGQSWSNWALNSGSPAVVMAVLQGATTGSGDTYWIATTSGLYRKIGAGTPQVVAGGGGYVISDVAVDPACPTRVYATYGFVPTRIQHRGGIVFSSDNGATWSSLTSGLDIHQGPVADVEVDPVDPEVLYAASYGRGYWMYDWGGSLPACQP